MNNGFSLVFLVRANVLPLKRFHAAVSVACDRLNDHSSNVRKNALTLLTALLRNNPFSPDLSGTNFRPHMLDLRKEFQVECCFALLFFLSIIMVFFALALFVCVVY